METEQIKDDLTPESDEPVVTLTARAIDAAKQYKDSPDVTGDGLRVGVRGGGCAGFQYALDFSNVRENDFVYDMQGLKVYIDPVSAIHLEGTIIDFVSSLTESGFKFINPHARSTCGCGSSYST